MTLQLEPPDLSTGNWLQRLPFYYGWVMVVTSAIAMTATLPGRKHGRSLVTAS